MDPISALVYEIGQNSASQIFIPQCGRTVGPLATPSRASPCVDPAEYIFLLGVTVSAHSAGAYTATLLVMVNVMKGGGRAVHPPPSPSLGDNFTLMMECTLRAESSCCNSVYSVVDPV